MNCTFVEWFQLCRKKGLIEQAKKEAEKNRRARRGLWNLETNAFNLIYGVKNRRYGSIQGQEEMMK